MTECIFNDALNTFYLRFYGVKYNIMVKDRRDERGSQLLLIYGLLLISSKGFFIYTIPQTGEHISQSLLHQLCSTG